jgi:hypothetical protein
MARKLRHALLAAACLIGLASSAFAQRIVYITNGDAQELQAIDVATGAINYTATTHSIGYPPAVRNAIWIGQRDNSGPSREYSLATGAFTGNQVTLTGPNFGNFVDAGVNGNVNYTLVAFVTSTTVYRTDPNWQNAVSMFSFSGSDIVGITYDSVTGTLWTSDQNNIYNYTLGGSFLSQFAQAGGRGSLAYEPATDTLWYVPNSSSSPLLQYSKAGALLNTVSTPTRSSNVWGAEFAVSAVPEPSTLLLGGLGAAGVWATRKAMRRRRARRK